MMSFDNFLPDRPIQDKTEEKVKERPMKKHDPLGLPMMSFDDFLPVPKKREYSTGS